MLMMLLFVKTEKQRSGTLLPCVTRTCFRCVNPMLKRACRLTREAAGALVRRLENATESGQICEKPP